MREVRVEGVTRVALLGKRLWDMGWELSHLVDYRVIIVGIPDVIPSRSATTFDRAMVSVFKAE